MCVRENRCLSMCVNVFRCVCVCVCVGAYVCLCDGEKVSVYVRESLMMCVRVCVFAFLCLYTSRARQNLEYVRQTHFTSHCSKKMRALLVCVCVCGCVSVLKGRFCVCRPLAPVSAEGFCFPAGVLTTTRRPSLAASELTAVPQCTAPTALYFRKRP